MFFSDLDDFLSKYLCCTYKIYINVRDSINNKEKRQGKKILGLKSNSVLVQDLGFCEL